MTLTVLNLHQETDPKVQQDFIGQGHYNKFKSRSHHDVAHLQPLANVPTKYQLPTPYGFRDIAQTRFYRSRSLWQGQIKVRPRCTPTPLVVSTAILSLVYLPMSMACGIQMWCVVKN